MHVNRIALEWRSPWLTSFRRARIFGFQTFHRAPCESLQLDGMRACQPKLCLCIRTGKGALLNLVDLVLTVCVLAEPSRCRTEHLYFESRGSLFQCMILAPAEIAKWSEGHPALKIVRWKCVFPNNNKDI